MKETQPDKEGIVRAQRLVNMAVFLLSVITLLFVFLVVDPTFSTFKSGKEKLSLEEFDEDKIENGIHLKTGLIDADGLEVVINNCTNCHSAKLVTQNRMSAERWNATIRWMQKTQNLWDLGENQKIIVDYLVANYPVEEKGRRSALSNIDWYELR